MFKKMIVAAGVSAMFLTYAADARQIEWSGYTWNVRTSGSQLQGPGPNLFSDGTQSVWVDGNGDLHLKIRQATNGKWYAAEIDMTESLSFGTYEWELSSRYDLFSPDAVAGMFTYLDPQSVANQTSGSVGNGIGDTPHEIDIEMTGAWGSANLYMTTHDPDVQSPSKNFYQALTGDFTTHRFTWAPDSIKWNSYNGHVAGVANPPNPIVEQRPGANNGNPAEFLYTGPIIPEDLNEIPIINFWLTGPNASVNGPANGLEQELIIHSFTYTPLATEPEPIPGDINGDGFVGIADLNIVLGNWNAGTPPAAGNPSIPEPATVLVWGAGCGCLSLRRRLKG
ncbi:MAG: hypothetical protein R3C45_01160 [Phycisphaerales bacterium]